MTTAAETSRSPRPPTRRRLRQPTLSFVVGAVVVVIGGYIGAAPLSDNSFFTHLATGRYILEHGFPSGDIYSFTAPGQRWVIQSWLPSILYATLDRAVGLVGIRVLSSLLAATVAGLIWALTRPARSLVPRLAIAVLGLTLGASMWAPRPLMVGLVLLGVTLMVAEERLPPWVLVPVFWLWVNSHGSFPLGLVALACYALGRRLDGERRPPELRALAWAVGGTALGAVNPLGPSLLTFPLTLLKRQDVLSSVLEWASPSFTTLYARVFLVVAAAGILGLVRRPSWRAAIPLVVFLAAGLVATRNLPVAMLVITPGLARAAAGLGSLDGERRAKAYAVMAAAVIAIGGLAIVHRLGEPDLDLADYPVDAVAWLDAQGRLGPDTRRAAPDIVGNYLELVLGDRAQVFSDDRVDMYPVDVVKDELSLIHASPEWRGVLDRWHIDVVLWQRDSPLVQLLALDPGWRLGYVDENWAVYERR